MEGLRFLDELLVGRLVGKIYKHFAFVLAKVGSFVFVVHAVFVCLRNSLSILSIRLYTVQYLSYSALRICISRPVLSNEQKHLQFFKQTDGLSYLSGAENAVANRGESLQDREFPDVVDICGNIQKRNKHKPFSFSSAVSDMGHNDLTFSSLE